MTRASAPSSIVSRGFMAAMTILAASAIASAQSADTAAARPVKLSGPRVGMTFLSDGVIDKLGEIDPEFATLNPLVSQFGWQFEKAFSSGGSRLTPVTEWVLLLGGLDQGVAIPSLTWLVGMRTAGGLEFGVGPNLTPASVSLAITAGKTLRSGNINFPINLAVVPSSAGVRVSLLTGFNVRK